MERNDALCQEYRTRFRALITLLDGLDEWDQDEIGAFLYLLRDVFIEDCDTFSEFPDWEENKRLFIRDVTRFADRLEKDNDPNQALAYRLFWLWLQALELDDSELIGEFEADFERFIEPAHHSGRTMDVVEGYTDEYSCPFILDDAMRYIVPWGNSRSGFRENPALKFVGEGNVAGLAMAQNELIWTLSLKPKERRGEFKRDFEQLAGALNQHDAKQRRQFGMQLLLVGDLILGDLGSLKEFVDIDRCKREVYIGALGHARRFKAKQGDVPGSLAFAAFRLMLCALHVKESKILLRCAASVDESLSHGGGRWQEDSRAALAASFRR